MIEKGLVRVEERVRARGTYGCIGGGKGVGNGGYVAVREEECEYVVVIESGKAYFTGPMQYCWNVPGV